MDERNALYSGLSTNEDLPLDGSFLWQGERKLVEMNFPETMLREYELKMLQYCNMKGILKPTVQRQLGQVRLQYDITGASLKNDKAAAEKYLQKLAELQAILPEYLISFSGVVVMSVYSFYFEDEKDWRFLYLPLQQKEGVQDLEFFRGFFYDEPEIFLQMEMMKENNELRLADYLRIVKRQEKKAIKDYYKGKMR